MNFQIILNAALFWLVASSLSYAGERPIIEISPAKMALKIVDIRTEAKLAPKWALTGQYVGGHHDGNRSGYKDRQQTFKLGAAWYPIINKTHSPFFGLALAHSNERKGHTAQRPRISYFFPRDGGDNDLWANEITTTSAVPEIGYRIEISKLITTSIRWSYDMPLMSDVTTIDKQITNKELKPEDADEIGPKQNLAFHLGIIIP